jgi:hypothetical protein
MNLTTLSWLGLRIILSQLTIQLKFTSLPPTPKEIYHKKKEKDKTFK